MKNVVKLLLIAVGSITLLGAACGDPGSGDETTPDAGAADLPYNKAAFLTAVAAVPDRDFTIYWIGDDPEAGDVQLTGPQFVPLSAAKTNRIASSTATLECLLVPVCGSRHIRRPRGRR